MIILKLILNKESNPYDGGFVQGFVNSVTLKAVGFLERLNTSSVGKTLHSALIAVIALALCCMYALCKILLLLTTTLNVVV
jgi:hypothetical protein